MTIKFLIINIIIFTLNYVSLSLFRQMAMRWSLLIDYPRNRSSHKRPTVRGAGAVFLLSTLLCWIYFEMKEGTGYMESFIIGAIVLAAVSFYDDLFRLDVKLRLLVHILAATLFLTQVRPPSIALEHFGAFALLWYPACIFFIVSSINLYNFMDGIDGMSVFHALAVLLSWILFSFILSGSVNYWMTSLVAALFAFVTYNCHPARLFMGDVGSTFLGFTFSCLAISQLNNVPRLLNFSAFLLLMLPFLFDTTFTIICRLLKGKVVHQPHRDFLFHRLVKAGHSHTTVSLVYTLVTLYNATLLIAIYFESIGIVVGLPLIILPYLSLYSWSVSSAQRQRLAQLHKITGLPAPHL